LDGEPLHIEVKTTRGRRSTAVYVSANEVAFSGRHPGTYRLYRLFEFDPHLDSAKYYVVRGSLEEHFSLEPIAFRVRLRSDDA
jgi:hypothetical protein